MVTTLTSWIVSNWITVSRIIWMFMSETELFSFGRFRVKKWRLTQKTFVSTLWLFRFFVNWLLILLINFKTMFLKHCLRYLHGVFVFVRFRHGDNFIKELLVFGKRFVLFNFFMFSFFLFLNFWLRFFYSFCLFLCFFFVNYCYVAWTLNS